jgi:hypothetical protein
MEGGDLLGAYERACELAEQKARLAGIKNAQSARHAQTAARNAEKRGKGLNHRDSMGNAN